MESKTYFISSVALYRVVRGNPAHIRNPVSMIDRKKRLRERDRPAGEHSDICDLGDPRESEIAC